MNKFTDKFSPVNDKNLERPRDTRNERTVKDDLPKIVFSFKDFDVKQIPPGQHYTEWQEDKLLAYMFEKFGEVCKWNLIEAQQQGILKIYDKFPPKSGFKHPQHIVEKVKWAVIMDIKGQKGRVAGHIINNVFYVVFLDRDHQFYITKKKGT